MNRMTRHDAKRTFAAADKFFFFERKRLKFSCSIRCDRMSFILCIQVSIEISMERWKIRQAQTTRTVPNLEERWKEMRKKEKESNWNVHLAEKSCEICDWPTPWRASEQTYGRRERLFDVLSEHLLVHFNLVVVPFLCTLNKHMFIHSQFEKETLTGDFLIHNSFVSEIRFTGIYTVKIQLKATKENDRLFLHWRLKQLVNEFKWIERENIFIPESLL